jgi:hypothetical protein
MLLAFPVRYKARDASGRVCEGRFTVPASKSAEARVIAREWIAAKFGQAGARSATLNLEAPR